MLWINIALALFGVGATLSAFGGDTCEKGRERLCPACGTAVYTHRCLGCRATVEVQPVNGMVVWMRNGRLVRAFRNEHKAYVEVATKMGIPSSEWNIEKE